VTPRSDGRIGYIRRMPKKPIYDGRPNPERAARARGSMRRFVAVMSVLFPRVSK
jgi:hypothetical protein